MSCLFGEIPFRGISLGINDYNIDKVRLLGYEPSITFEDGLDALLKWKDHGE